jgi:hypothetical protein
VGVAAAAAAVSAVAVLRGFTRAAPPLAAVAAGTFAWRLLPAPPNTKPQGARAWVILLSAGCAAFGCWTIVLLRDKRTRIPVSGPTHVHISTPTKNQSVGQRLDRMHGTVRNLAPGDALWLMVQTIGESGYYPMSTPCAITAPGNWTCERVYVGPDGQDHHRYRILVRILDGRTQQRVINDWAAQQTGRGTVSYDYPLGRPAARVIVQRFGPA